MDHPDLSKKLSWIVGLLAANLLAMTAVACAMLFGFLQKVERAVQTTERVEARFQSFADEVQPVITTGAGKAVETIQKIDAQKLSETATEKADTLIDAAAEKAKRYLERDKKQDE